MANAPSGFGKPKLKRTVPREIEPSAAAPDLTQDVPEPVDTDDNEFVACRQSGASASDRITQCVARGGIPRKSLSDAQWRRLSPFLTGKKGDRGRTARNSRLTVEGILWRFRVGAPWRDLPAHFGNWNSVYRSFRRWCRRGVFLRLLLSLARELDLRVLLVDGTFVKVHQHAAGAPKRGRQPDISRSEQALGVSRGGLTTKVMLLIDRRGRLAGFSLAPGNTFEAHELPALLSSLPASETAELLGDKAYDTNKVRGMLAELGIVATIPSKSNRKKPIPHDTGAYKGRGLVENVIADLKHFRGIATRYCKYAEMYAAGFQLVAWHLQTRGRRQRQSMYLEGR